MSHPVISFDNFWEEVRLFCHGQPKKADGLGFVLKDEESPAAKLWIAYARNKGWDNRAKFFVHMLRQGNALTMPCADPRTFDPEYNPRAGDETIRERPAAPIPNFSPRTIAAQIAETAKKMGPPSHRRRQDNETEDNRPKPPTLDELKAMLIPPMSDALRKTLGLKPAEAQQEQREGEAA